jgi:hypothetical protein
MTDLELLKLMVRGAYDLQKLRMQCGLRLCASFRAKLGLLASTALSAELGDTEDDDAGEDMTDEETAKKAKDDKEAKKIIKQLRLSYRRLTDGIAKHRTLPAEKGFTGDDIISTFTELTLVDQYVRLEGQEALHFRQMEAVLDKIPIYQSYLSAQVGVGPAMAGVLVTYLDPAKARYVSSFWAFAGCDVARDGAARSRRQEHLVERTYIDREGHTKTRMGVTFNPFLRTKMLGVLAGSFLRSGSPWRVHYDNYKHRLETDPARIKVALVEWKKRKKTGEDMRNLWAPGRINNAAKRYMIKMFLAELWATWRRIEGLPVTPAYQEAKLGHKHAS